MSHYLVDTNIWSEAMKRKPDAGVIEWLRRAERELFISALTIGEIKCGIELLPAGRRRHRYQTWLTELANRMEGRILSFNTSVAIVWGQMLAQCDAKGIVLPTIDSQIAATAKRHSLVIATRNEDDFALARVKTFNPFL